MIFKRLIGTLTLFVSSADPVSLLNEIIKANITVLSSTSGSFSLEIKILFTDYFKLKKIIKSRDEKIEKIKSSGGIISLFYRYRLRYGIAAGFVVSLMLSIYLSNTLLEVKIYGADDETKRQIMNVLSREGVGVGSFLPAVDRLSLECEIIENTSTVALVNSRTEGSALCFDIKMIDEIPQLEHSRLSADIIATHDGNITNMEIFSGNAVKNVGDEVKKGDVLVSGEMTLRGKLLDIKKTVYFHSSGKVYADYDESVSFYVPFDDVEQTSSKEGTRKYVQFYSAQIPFNPLVSNHKGCRESSRVSNLNIFGVELPIGITTKTYESFEYTKIKRTEKGAIEKAHERIDKYEKNLLSDKTILSKSESVSKSEQGITITVKYRLNGEIGRVQEILKK